MRGLERLTAAKNFEELSAAIRQGLSTPEERELALRRCREQFCFLGDEFVAKYYKPSRAEEARATE